MHDDAPVPIAHSACLSTLKYRYCICFQHSVACAWTSTPHPLAHQLTSWRSAHCRNGNMSALPCKHTTQCTRHVVPGRIMPLEQAVSRVYGGGVCVAIIMLPVKRLKEPTMCARQPTEPHMPPSQALCQAAEKQLWCCRHWLTRKQSPSTMPAIRRHIQAIHPRYVHMLVQISIGCLDYQRNALLNP